MALSLPPSECPGSREGSFPGALKPEKRLLAHCHSRQFTAAKSNTTMKISIFPALTQQTGEHLIAAIFISLRMHLHHSLLQFYRGLAIPDDILTRRRPPLLGLHHQGNNSPQMTSLSNTVTTTPSPGPSPMNQTGAAVN